MLRSHKLDTLWMALTGALFFVYRYGTVVLDPTRNDWLLGRSDPAANLLAWYFFRQDPWVFPPGRIPSFDWPAGTSVALSDALPLFAIPFKLFSGVLPEDFHYWGIWLLTCHILQAVFAHALISTMSEDRRVRISGALLALFMPAWLHRIGHMAISAHWVLLAAWWLYHKETKPGGFRVRFRRWGILLGVTAWIHPYLWVLAFGTAVASWLRSSRQRRIDVRTLLGLLVGTVCLTLLLWYLSGALLLVGTDSYRSEGLGTYSMNLNSLFNSSGTSRWVPPLQLKYMGQYEGYNYLGLSLLFLTPLALLATLFSADGRRRLLAHREALVLGMLATLYALSPIWTWGDGIVLKIPWPALLGQLGDVFRATGRIFWICLYALLAFVVSETIRAVGSPRAGWVLAGAALLMFVEMRPMEHVGPLLDKQRFAPAFDLEVMAESVPEQAAVVLVPPRSINDQDWKEWALVALKRRGSFSGGYIARRNAALRESFSREVEERLASGTVDRGTVYVVGVEAMATVCADSVEAELREGYWLVWKK